MKTPIMTMEFLCQTQLHYVLHQILEIAIVLNEDLQKYANLSYTNNRI